MKTKEQEEYVAEIIGKKRIPKVKYKKRIATPVAVETKKTDYMRNCIFWIDEFIEGRTDIEQLRKSIMCLQTHLIDIKTKYLK